MSMVVSRSSGGSRESSIMLPLLLFVCLLPVVVQCAQLSTADDGDRTNDMKSSRNLLTFAATGINRRQFIDFLDLVTDVAMLTLVGVPILGLVALGATFLGPLFGFGGAATGAAAAAGRKKRDLLVDRAGKVLVYARNLFDVLANLDDAFQKYDIRNTDCQLRAVCEAHRPENKGALGNFGQRIVGLIRMQKDLEEQEVIPFAKFIFGQYADAAQYGTEQNDCAAIYKKCSQSTQEFLNRGQNLEPHRP